MEKDTIYVALDDSKRKLVIAILRPGATEPEEQEIPKDPPHIQRLFRRLRREGSVRRRKPPATWCGVARPCGAMSCAGGIVS